MLNWLSRKNAALERDMHKSDPHLHGPQALKWMRRLGHPVATAAYWLAGGIWVGLFVAVGCDIAAPATYRAWLHDMSALSGLSLISLAGDRLWFGFLAASLFNTCFGYFREQRRRLFAEGRLRP